MRKNIVDMNYLEQTIVLQRMERELCRRYPGIENDMLFREYLLTIAADLTKHDYWNSEKYNV